MKPKVCPDCGNKWTDHTITMVRGSLTWVCNLVRK